LPILHVEAVKSGRTAPATQTTARFNATSAVHAVSDSANPFRKLKQGRNNMAEGMAGFHKKSILDKASQKNGKLDNSSPLAQPPKQPSCPQCGSNKLYKDGLRYLTDGTTVQRWLCRQCYYRFSQQKPLQKNQECQINTASTLLSNRQVCELLTAESKNLTEVETRQEKPMREGTTQPADIKGKIVEYLWHLKKKGLKEPTVKQYSNCMDRLLEFGVDILQPEEVKKFVATNECWSERTKGIVITIYDSFLNWLGIPWNPPVYRPIKKLPFIPTEEEIDQLIARAGRRLAPFLQLLKETGMRRGEAAKLKWTDVDFKRKTITITPEKGSNPRILSLSDTALGMLSVIPRKADKIFASLSSVTSNFYMQRRTLAAKLNDPRIRKISLHSFRHWKATMEYHKTKDLIRVQQMLGHADIKSTMIYINLEEALFNIANDEFHVKTAKTVEEACKLAEVGFEHFDTIDNVHLYRKRK